MGVLVSVLCVLIFAALHLALFCYFRKRSKFSRVKPLRKRVVVMRSNVLYASSSSDAGKKPGCQGGFAPLLPHVKIEGVGRGRMVSDRTSTSEYEIPLDRQWEFPRNKWVMVYVCY